MDLRNKKVGVIGLRGSGLAAIKFLSRKGALVRGFGFLTSDELIQAKEYLKGSNAELILDEKKAELLFDSNFIVLTMGGGRFESALEEAKEKGVPVLSDLELASQFYSSSVIGVTGTNGKSSVIAMLETLFELAGKKVALAGGDSSRFADVVQSSETPDYYLFELSSARLQKTSTFRPHIAVFMNLYPGHGERHETFEEYGRMKAKIFSQQGQEDFLVYQSTPDVLRLLKEVGTKATKLPFSLEKKFRKGAFFGPDKKDIIVRMPTGKDFHFPIKNFSLPGPHNLENLMAVLCVGKICGIPDEILLKSIPAFKPLFRRTELIQDIGGVKIYDDSRSVNVMATLTALLGFPDKKVILIVGGDYIRQQFYKILTPVLERKVKCLVIFGRYRERFYKKWVGATESFLVKTLEEGVKVAVSKAEKGDIILFSPAAKPDPTVHQGFKGRSEAFRKSIEKEAGFLKARRILTPKV